MFMRKMRGSASLVMGIMAAAFVGWLVFDGINAMQGGNLGGSINPVVGQVGGQDIRYNEWNIFLQNQLAVNRAADRGMTDEDVRVVTERAWESLISATPDPGRAGPARRQRDRCGGFGRRSSRSHRRRC